LKTALIAYLKAVPGCAFADEGYGRSFFGWGRSGCKTCLGLYLDKKNSFSSDWSISWSRVEKSWGR